MVIASSRMGHLWDALCRAHDVDAGGGQGFGHELVESDRCSHMFLTTGAAF